MKVLHLPTSVGGHVCGLAEAERALGLDSKVLLAFENYLGYKADISLGLRAGSALEQLLAAAKLARTFFKIRNSYDVYHFNFGKTLLDFYCPPVMLADLPYYHKKAKLFVTYNGCDARQKYPTVERTDFSACHSPECYGGVCNSGARDGIKRRKIEKFSRYASHMFALNPDLMWFLPKEKASFLPYAVDGFDRLSPAFPDFSRKTLRILHAPTNRAAKGSGQIIRAVENVIRRRPGELELVLVESVAHERALELYAQADLVIDQLLVGWYGGFAVEAMRLGKPVLSYVREEDLCWIPVRMRAELNEALVRVDPDSLELRLEQLLDDRAALGRFAANGYEYAGHWHDPGFVAGQVVEKYDAA